MAEALLVGLIAAPLVLMVLLRINAPLVFLSICLGVVLLQFVGGQATDMLKLLVPKSNDVSKSTIQLALVLTPVVLTMLFMIKTVKKKRLVMNILPAVGASFLLFFVVKPLLSPGTVGTIESSQLWPTIDKAQELIVGAGALICLLFLWMQRPKTHEESDKKHKR